MSTETRRKHEDFLHAVEEDVSPALESVDFEALLGRLVKWAEAQKPPLEERTNTTRTTIAYAIPENDILIWRVAPRLKDGAKVEVLPRDSALLPARARTVIAKLLEALSPGTDLEPDRRLMIPLHNLAEPKAMKQFLALLDASLKAARRLKRPS